MTSCMIRISLMGDWYRNLDIEEKTVSNLFCCHGYANFLKLKQIQVENA